MVSTDVYRPAAILQLQTLATQVGAGFAAALASEAPVSIARRALTEATLQAYDVLLLDTAGRLHVDAEMMAEVKELEAAVSPHERLFVVDSMTGQDAANTAKAFHEALPLTGVILTKTDAIDKKDLPKTIAAAKKALAKFNKDILTVSILDDDSVKKLGDDIIKKFRKK